MWSRGSGVLAEWRSLFEGRTDECPSSNVPLSLVTCLHQKYNDDRIVPSFVSDALITFRFKSCIPYLIIPPSILSLSLCVCVCVSLCVCYLWMSGVSLVLSLDLSHVATGDSVLLLR
jgi:hypothetical protein